MNINSFCNKIRGLFLTLNNPFFFLYRVSHYLNRYIPRRLANYIKRKNNLNYKKSGVKDFQIETYDGSGQAVHPDIVFFENQYWLAVTPYPYGMEEYENPCIYHGDDLLSLLAPDGPIAVQHTHKIGVHLSDPCFAVKGKELYFYYRESERKDNLEKHTIWGILYSLSSKSWSRPVKFLSSNEDKLLSPAMLYDDSDELTIFYVSSINNQYTLVYTTGDSVGGKLTKCIINGMPNGYYLWHIGIKRVNEIYPDNKDSRDLMGLFLLKSEVSGRGMKLFEAKNNGSMAEWTLSREIGIPEEIKDLTVFPYKSCFIPNQKGAILLSFRDKKSRNRLIIVS